MFTDFFFEYGAVQQVLKDYRSAAASYGTKVERIVECESSAMEPKKISDELGQKIALSLSAGSHLAETQEADIEAVEEVANRMEDRSEYGGGIILSWARQVRRLKGLAENG